MDSNQELLLKLSQLHAELHALKEDVNQMWRVVMILLTAQIGLRVIDTANIASMTQSSDTIQEQMDYDKSR